MAEMAAGSGPVAVAVADFNGDGIPDVVPILEKKMREALDFLTTVFRLGDTRKLFSYRRQ